MTVNAFPTLSTYVQRRHTSTTAENPAIVTHVNIVQVGLIRQTGDI